MKRLVIVVAALALSAGSAVAQDANFDWSGAYVGVQVGHGWGDSIGGVYGPDGLLDAEGDVDPDGFLGGIYAGYNHQLDNNVILGAEADLNYAHLTGDVEPLNRNGIPISGNSASAEMTWSGSARIRAGYAFDRLLPYVAGGITFGRYEFTPNYFGTGPLPGAKTQTGWTVGAGVEYAATDNLIIRAEYRYSDFGDAKYGIPRRSGYETRVDLKTHDLRIGIAYKF